MAFVQGEQFGTKFHSVPWPDGGPEPAVFRHIVHTQQYPPVLQPVRLVYARRRHVRRTHAWRVGAVGWIGVAVDVEPTGDVARAEILPLVLELQVPDVAARGSAGLQVGPFIRRAEIGLGCQPFDLNRTAIPVPGRQAGLPNRPPEAGRLRLGLLKDNVEIPTRGGIAGDEFACIHFAQPRRPAAVHLKLQGGI
ncbi:hypothetical protein D0T25_12175 [Duganella sp. BJB488]|nr:hypothetical protein D0T25_12175 [Duganella sp. BJB488]